MSSRLPSHGHTTPRAALRRRTQSLMKASRSRTWCTAGCCMDLAEPEEAIRRMVAALASAGVLAAEDLDQSSVFVYPASTGRRASASAGRGGIDEHRRVIEILRHQDTGRRERGDHPAYRLFRLGEIRAHTTGCAPGPRPGSLHERLGPRPQRRPRSGRGKATGMTSGHPLTPAGWSTTSPARPCTCSPGTVTFRSVSGCLRSSAISPNAPAGHADGH